jgi:hypothetical protein
MIFGGQWDRSNLIHICWGRKSLPVRDVEDAGDLASSIAARSPPRIPSASILVKSSGKRPPQLYALIYKQATA